MAANLLPADRPPVPPEVNAYLERRGLAALGATAFPLTGDASDRRYFRLLKPGGESLVVALHAAPFDFETLPFVNVARLLEQVPVPIPAILDHAGDLGILAVEDLGDVTLQAHLGAASQAQHQALYRQAVGFIERIQERGRELESAEFIPYGIAFDVEKLTWELNFFLKHFVEGYRGIRLSQAEREALQAEWVPVVEELAAEPRVLCHRDYHSRNLMLRRDGLYIIDFQDARMGPDTYDLASLLRDAYTDFTEEAVEDLIAYFLALKGALRGIAVGEAASPYARDFRRRFDLMSLQRNLKALGTFGYQTVVRQNPVYIQYTARTLQYVRTNLRRYARFERLMEILASHLPELA
ncbi:MAG: aminoglycoside phosphotransferase family protein [Vicinamibacterales bacterium]